MVSKYYCDSCKKRIEIYPDKIVITFDNILNFHKDLCKSCFDKLINILRIKEKDTHYNTKLPKEPKKKEAGK